MDIDTQLETKAGLPPDALVTHGDMMRLFEDFKQTNDERLASTDKRRGDVLLEEKVGRMNEALTSHQRQLDEINVNPLAPRSASERAPLHRMAIASTRPPSTPMCAAARAPACARSRPRRCRSAPIPTAAIWCRTRSSTRSAARLTAISPIRAIAGVREISATSTRSRS